MTHKKSDGKQLARFPSLPSVTLAGRCVACQPASPSTGGTVAEQEAEAQ
jgi:hypothetical protein